jgi:hypothetical protein
VRAQKGTVPMPQRPTSRKPAATEPVGPVKPGTPLYRALEMIAQAIAKKLDECPPTKDGRQLKAKP